MSGKPYYICGPMSGYPQFNIPAFDAAAAYMRSLGYYVVSPAELDSPEERAACLASPDGQSTGKSWGSCLARDVQIVADEVEGLVLLDNWEKSRGAKLEAYVGLLCGHNFLRLCANPVLRLVDIQNWQVRLWLL